VPRKEPEKHHRPVSSHELLTHIGQESPVDISRERTGRGTRSGRENNRELRREKKKEKKA
jgi:hypothetical protein